MDRDAQLPFGKNVTGEYLVPRAVQEIFRGGFFTGEMFGNSLRGDLFARGIFRR